MARNSIDVVVKGDYDDKDINRAIKDLEKLQAASQSMTARVNDMGRQMQAFGGQVSAVGGSLTKGLTLPILAAGAGLVGMAKVAEEAEIANRKLGNVLESMGFGEATDRVQSYAESLERTIGVDAELIKATQTKLATFENLTKTVGETGGAFDRATMAAVDLAAAGFGSAETNAVQLGKALQDPVKGITALARAGVTFTAQEKEKIKALVESGNILAAQDMVLAAIEKQVGGTAEAGVSAFDRIKLSLEQVAETIGMAVLPLIQQIADFVANTIVPTVVPLIEQFSAAWRQLDPDIQKVIFAVVGFLAAIGPVLLIVGKLITVIGGLLVAFNPLTLKILAIIAIVALLAAGFKFLWDNSETLRDTVTSVFETIKTVVGSVVAEVKRVLDENKESIDTIRLAFGQLADFLITYVVPVLATFTGTYLKILITVLGEILKLVINIIGAFVLLIAKLIEVGAFLVTWTAAAIATFQEFFLNITKAVTDAFTAVRDFITSTFKAIYENIVNTFRSAINFVIRGINGVINAWNAITFTVPEVTVPFVGTFGGQTVGVRQLGTIPELAEGGIVYGPTLAMIGEAGPEAVVPLSRRGGGLGTTINLTVNAGMGTDGADVGRQIVDALRTYQRRNGPVPISVA